MGKFSDKFLNAFNLRGNDDEYDDEYDEEYDDYYEDEEDYIEEDEPVEEEPAPSNKGGFLNRSKKPAAPARPAQNFGGSRGSQEVCIFKPSSIEDSREITETLLQGKAVVINFEGLHVEISQRIIDFISGSCYAIDGNLQKISNYIFIATPDSVDLSGDFQNLFDDSDAGFNAAGFKSPLL